MDSISLKTVAEVVTKNFKTANVFKKYGIDFSYEGDLSLAETCAKQNLDLHEVEQALMAVEDQPITEQDFERWELDFLIDYITNVHHAFVYQHLPLLMEYSEKISKKHGGEFPETVEIMRLVESAANELYAHMRKEEQVIFPYIKQMVNAKKEERGLPRPPFDTLQNPIRMMELEHDSTGGIFERIAKLTHQYNPPPGASPAHQLLYVKLKEFERDLKQHVHLEDVILFPKVIELEASF